MGGNPSHAPHATPHNTHGMHPMAVQVKKWDCDVPCEFSTDASRPFDGNEGGYEGTYPVLRSMEPASIYSNCDPEGAHRMGIKVSADWAPLACIVKAWSSEEYCNMLHSSATMRSYNGTVVT